MTAKAHITYGDFFYSAFPGHTQFDYRWRLAAAGSLPSFVNAVPRAGKTAAATGAKGS
jgi:hypothetical protein